MGATHHMINQLIDPRELDFGLSLPLWWRMQILCPGATTDRLALRTIEMRT